MNNTRASLIAFGLLVGSTWAQDTKSVIQPKELWTNFVADQDVALHFTIAAAHAPGRLTWTFAAANGRVYDRGRGEAEVPAGGKTVKVALHTPPLKPGVVQEALLTVTLSVDGKAVPVSNYQKKIWIFPPDAFADRTKWLEGLRIKVYDPDPKARTAALFKEMKIPFEDVPRAGALAEVQVGVVIVGQGAAFQEDPELMPALVQAAARGVRVLCLAPASGTFALPGSDPPQPPLDKGGSEGVAGGLMLARQDIVRKLDKRLDAAVWSGSGGSVTSSLAIKAEEGRVVAEVVPGNKGWPWLAVEFPTPSPRAGGENGKNRGWLIVSGFAIVGAWESGPTPRYLLARILEQFDE